MSGTKFGDAVHELEGGDLTFKGLVGPRFVEIEDDGGKISSGLDPRWDLRSLETPVVPGVRDNKDGDYEGFNN